MREGTVNRSACSQERAVTLANSTWRKDRVKLAAIFAAIRLAMTAPPNTDRAQRTISEPHSSSCRLSPVGATSSMICSKIQGRISSKMVAVNLIPLASPKRSSHSTNASVS